MESDPAVATDAPRLNSTLPKFNTIKLDLKAMSNNPDDVHIHNQHNPRIEPLHPRRNVDDSDPEQGRARGFERDSQYDVHHRSQQGGPYIGFTPLDTRSPSPLSSPARHRFGSGEPLHKTHALDECHDGLNPNPNGESPTQPERAPSPYYETSRTGYSSHFVPMGEEIKDKEGRRDEMDDELARSKKQQIQDAYRPGFRQLSHPPLSRNVSGSPPPQRMPIRAQEEGYPNSEMSLDDDGNPMYERRRLMEKDEEDEEDEEEDEEGHGRYNGQHHHRPRHQHRHSIHVSSGEPLFLRQATINSTTISITINGPIRIHSRRITIIVNIIRTRAALPRTGPRHR
ncbi:hypothetical protein BGZ72_006608 [Mortierella alpina]|nr:hypothetical protein BGZ72_006608 [Mortierella alpina]